MSDNSKYHKIGSIVDQFISDNFLTQQYYPKALSKALWGLRELRLDTWQDVKTVLLTITDRRTVVLPGDFVDWVKVGVKRGQYCITFGTNDALATTSRTADDSSIGGLLSQSLPNGFDINSYGGGYYFFNYSNTSVFGIGSGLPSKGYFKVHNNGDCKELLLDYDILGTEIYLEYITDGFDPCSETVVNPYFADYVLKCIEFWYEEKVNPNRTEASIQRKGRELFTATRKASGRVNQIDKQTMLNISRANVRFTPKV